MSLWQAQQPRRCKPCGHIGVPCHGRLSNLTGAEESYLGRWRT